MPYEFRTMAVKGKHTREIFEEIGRERAGGVFYPKFPEQKTLAEEYKNEEGFSEYELAEFKN